jgi:signal transduction histidine kinase
VEANKELRIEISERLRAEEELKIAKEGAESANRAKSDFLTNMSHELRTPLNAIIGFSEILIDRQCGELNQLQDEYLRDVHQSSRHLLSLINDILDLSKVEAGKMELELAEVHLKPLLANSLVMIKERALKHGIQVQMEEDRLPATVQADERKIKQVLFNLLSNAVKFTPNQGVIRLQARAINRINGHWVGRNEQAVALPREATPELDGQKDWILISVADSGIGILPQDLERIFKPFEQADNSAGRQFQGTGLGLSLTKQLVELHGGRVWGESEGVEEGSKFSFVIPVDCRPANEKKG